MDNAKKFDLKSVLFWTFLDYKCDLGEAYTLIDEMYEQINVERPDKVDGHTYLEVSENICILLELLGSLVTGEHEDRARPILAYMLKKGVPDMHVFLRIPSNIDALHATTSQLTLFEME